MTEELTRREISGEVERAAERIGEYLEATPLLYSQTLSRLSGCRVHLKLENRQPTGSFKLRGAFSKLLWLKQREVNPLVVTASTGNHALAMAFVMQRLGMQGKIFVPAQTAASKLELLAEFRVPVEKIDAKPEVVERQARQWAMRQGGNYVSPYNDKQVLAGQGTLALELLKQYPQLNTVYASVGGGGLVSGIAGCLKFHRPGVEIVGCQPANDAAMFASIEAGKIVAIEARDTLSDGTAGGIDADSLTFASCRDLVDDWQLVAEAAISSALRQLHGAPEWPDSWPLEGAAGVAIAAFLAHVAENPAGREIVVVICGGNIEPRKFQQIVATGAMSS